MAVSLFAANEGFLDDVDVNKVVDFEAALHAYAQQQRKALLDKINTTGDYDEEIEAELKSLLEAFKKTGTY